MQRPQMTRTSWTTPLLTRRCRTAEIEADSTSMFSCRAGRPGQRTAGLRGVRELPRPSGDPTRHRHSHTPTRPGHTRRRTALRLRYYMPCGGRIGSFAPRVIGGSSPSALSFIAAVSKMVAFWWPIYSAGAAHALIISRRPLVTRLLTIKVTLRGVIVRSEPYH